MMDSKIGVRGKRHFGGAHFELAVEFSKVAVDNLFELDNRRDAADFDGFLRRQAIRSTKQRHQEQQREAHHDFLSMSFGGIGCRKCPDWPA